MPGMAAVHFNCVHLLFMINCRCISEGFAAGAAHPQRDAKPCKFTPCKRGASRYDSKDYSLFMVRQGRNSPKRTGSTLRAGKSSAPITESGSGTRIITISASTPIPAQDCEKRCGDNVHLFRIDTLTRDACKETLLSSDIPDTGLPFYKEGGHHLDITEFNGHIILVHRRCWWIFFIWKTGTAQRHACFPYEQFEGYADNQPLTADIVMPSITRFWQAR